MKNKLTSLFVCICLGAVFSDGLHAQEIDPPSTNEKPASPEAEKPNGEKWVALQNKDLLFRLSTDKQIYRIGEKVTLRAELKNNSDTSHKVIPISAVFGNYPGEGIRIKGPQKIGYVGMHKNLAPLKRVVLPANTTISAEYIIDDKFKGFGGKGTYTISCSAAPVEFEITIEVVEADKDNKHNNLDADDA